MNHRAERQSIAESLTIRPPITPPLAVRVALLGGLAFVLFAIVFFRLWFLQVLSGDQYLAAANDNRVRELKIEAPRGEIVDPPSKLIPYQPWALERRNELRTKAFEDPQGHCAPSGAPRMSPRSPSTTSS